MIHALKTLSDVRLSVGLQMENQDPQGTALSFLDHFKS